MTEDQKIQIEEIIYQGVVNGEEIDITTDKIVDWIEKYVQSINRVNERTKKAGDTLPDGAVSGR